MLIIKGFLRKCQNPRVGNAITTSSSSLSWLYFTWQSLLKIIVAPFLRYKVPTRVTLRHWIARTGKVQPRAAHLFAQSLCFSATPVMEAWRTTLLKAKECPCSACCETCRQVRAIPTRTCTYRPEHPAAQLSV